jgi:hypothetical protein
LPLESRCQSELLDLGRRTNARLDAVSGGEEGRGPRSAFVAAPAARKSFDRGVNAGVRAGSPYAPLPPEIHGDSATLELPLISVHR